MTDAEIQKQLLFTKGPLFGLIFFFFFGMFKRGRPLAGVT